MNTNIFFFIAVLVLKLLSRKVLFTNKKDKKNLKIRLLFKKIADFTDKLLQNQKQVECEVFRILLKHVMIVYQCFFYLHDCTFKYILNTMFRVRKIILVLHAQLKVSKTIATSQILTTVKSTDNWTFLLFFLFQQPYSRTRI